VRSKFVPALPAILGQQRCTGIEIVSAEAYAVDALARLPAIR